MKQYSTLVYVVGLLFLCNELARAQVRAANRTNAEPSATTTMRQPIAIRILLKTTMTTTTTKAPSTTTNATSSNEKQYELVSKHPSGVDEQLNTSFPNHQDQSTNATSSGEGKDVHRVEKEPSIFENMLSQFNRSTLIMAAAFFIGLFLIALLVTIGLCLFKNMKKELPTLISNPAYDEEKKPNKKAPIYKIDFLDGDDDDQDLLASTYIGEKRPPNGIGNGTMVTSEVIEMQPLVRPAEKPASNDVDSSPPFMSTSRSSSKSSIDSKAIDPRSPQTPAVYRNSPKTPSTPQPQSRVSDSTQSHTNNDFPKYTPSHVNKTQQQLNKETQNSTSRRSLLNRKSECDNPNMSSLSSRKQNRESLVSSTSSSITNLQATTILDFGQAKEGVDDVIKTMRQDIDINRASGTVSRTSLFTDGNSLHNSASDIYIKAIAEKREQMQKTVHAKLSNQITNLSSDTMASSSRTSTPNNQAAHRHSMGALNAAVISSDPRGSNRVSGFSQSRTESVNTLESEKSCY